MRQRTNWPSEFPHSEALTGNEIFKTQTDWFLSEHVLVRNSEELFPKFSKFSKIWHFSYRNRRNKCQKIKVRQWYGNRFLWLSEPWKSRTILGLCEKSVEKFEKTFFRNPELTLWTRSSKIARRCELAMSTCRHSNENTIVESRTSSDFRVSISRTLRLEQNRFRFSFFTTLGSLVFCLYRFSSWIPEQTNSCSVSCSLSVWTKTSIRIRKSKVHFLSKLVSFQTKIHSPLRQLVLKFSHSLRWSLVNFPVLCHWHAIFEKPHIKTVSTVRLSRSLKNNKYFFHKELTLFRDLRIIWFKI